MALTLILIFTSVFLGVFAFVVAGATAGQSPTSRLKSRLHRMAEGERRVVVAESGAELIQGQNSVEKFFYSLPLMLRVRRAVEGSGLTISPMFFVLWITTAAIACFALFYLVQGNLWIALAAGICVFFCANAYLIYKKDQRLNKFTEQLPDALTMIARSLRAGHSLTGAVELVSEELAEPTKSLFRLAYEQQQLGMRMVDALAKLPDRMDSMDLRFFITIIRINSETGGNLSEVLDKLSDTIRARLQIRRQVQVITAEGRVSGIILFLLPIATFFMFNAMRPGYMQVFFTDHTCGMLLIAAAVAQVIGFLFIRKIINIRI